MSALHVNGREHTVDADPGTPILWALRDTLGMTGTKSVSYTHLTLPTNREV